VVHSKKKTGKRLRGFNESVGERGRGGEKTQKKKELKMGQQGAGLAGRFPTKRGANDGQGGIMLKKKGMIRDRGKHAGSLGGKGFFGR